MQILQNQLTNKFSFYSWHEPYKMATFREAWEALLFAYQDGSIDDTELALLYDFNSSENLEFPYWKYGRFDLDFMTDDECKVEFRFFKNDIYLLGDVFGIPDIMKCPNGVLVDGMEALSVLLKRFAYPCRFADMIARFGRPVPQLCMITNRMMDYIFDEYSHLLADLNQPWLSRDRLRHVAATIHDKGAPLENFWGLIDGTVRPLCKLDQNQRILYNGHKRVHGIKYQSVVAPNGLIASLFGPVEGRRHDSGMLVDSGLLQELSQYSFAPDGTPLCVYGDPAHPLQGPFKGANLTQAEQQFNKAMSQVRDSVEWLFGDIVNYVAFLDFKKNVKIGLSPVGKMYIVCALLRNAYSCLYQSSISKFFGIDPPQINDYYRPYHGFRRHFDEQANRREVTVFVWKSDVK